MLDQPTRTADAGMNALGANRVKRAAKPRRSGIGLQITLLSVAIVAGSTAIYPLLPRIYSATASILLHATNQEGATTWNQSVQDALDDNAIQTKIDILKSRPLQLEVVRQLGLMQDPEFNPALRPSWMRQQAQTIPWLAPWLPVRRSDDGLVAEELIQHLVVKRERKSYLIQVGYESRDSVKAAHMTDVLANGFLADQITRKRHSHDDLLATLLDRVTTLEAKYHQDEQTEHDFLVGSGLIHRSEKDAMVRQIENLSTAVAEVSRRAVETGNRAEILVAQSAKNLDATSDALSSPLIQRLRERLVELTAGAGTTSAPAGLNMSSLRSFQKGIEDETQHIVRSAQVEAQIARTVEASLREALRRLDIKMVQWQDKERTAEDLHRAVRMDLEAINTSYQRYTQEAGRGDALQSDSELVAFATPPDRPAFPNPLFFLAGTLALVILMDGLVLLPTVMGRIRRHAL